jgi:hypothetical protein
MKRRLLVVAIMLGCVFAASPTIAKIITDANGNAAGVVRSNKTGATARVGVQFAARFQAYVDDIEARGAEVRFMGGIRRGHCWSGGMHPCGKALDVCQTGRGRVDPRCHLPSRHELARIAAAHGLIEGGRWHNSDYGHAQVGGYSGIALEGSDNATKNYSARSRASRTTEHAGYRVRMSHLDRGGVQHGLRLFNDR